MHVAAIDLAAPTIAYFDLAVALRGSVADDEMVGQSIPHPPHSSMIIIERARVPLPRPAVVHDDKFPARPLHRRSPDRLDVRARQITIVRRLARPWPETASRRRRRWRFETLFFLQA